MALELGPLPHQTEAKTASEKRLCWAQGDSAAWCHSQELSLDAPEMPPCSTLPMWSSGGRGAGAPPTKATARGTPPSSPVCVRTCLFRSKVSLKPLPQKVHRCLFTWLWHLRCRLSMRCRRKALPHSSQLWAAGSLHVPVVNWGEREGGGEGFSADGHMSSAWEHTSPVFRQAGAPDP